MAHPEKALLWYDRLIEKNPMAVFQFDVTREKIIKYIDDFNATGITQWEQENGLESHNLNQKERYERFYEFGEKVKNIIGKDVLEEISSTEKKFESLYQKYSNLTATSDEIHIDLPKLIEYCKKGSITAKLIFNTLSNYFEAIDYLYQKDIQFFLYHFTLAVKSESYAIRIQYNEFQGITQTLESILDYNGDIKSETDQNARICLCFMKIENPKQNLDFVKNCLKKYPDCEFFYESVDCYLAFLGRHEEAIIICDEGLKRFLNSIRLI